MNYDLSDRELLNAAARRLGVEAKALLLRYYGSPQDMHDELEEFRRTGRLQADFAQLLRRELAGAQLPAE
jgi:hypothetical protein